MAFRPGAGLFQLDLPLVSDDASNALSPAMRKLLSDMFADLRRLKHRSPGRHRPSCSRCNGRQFQKARELAALGFVRWEHSTEGKRKLLVHGARSCFWNLDRTRIALEARLKAAEPDAVSPVQKKRLRA